jgi:hypothetical protein
MSTDDRGTALAGFEEARTGFTEVFGSVPDEALGYLKPEDDYALGGLVFHVNAILEHYGVVLPRSGRRALVRRRHRTRRDCSRPPTPGRRRACSPRSVLPPSRA